jgi:hypothetical protein
MEVMVTRGIAALAAAPLPPAALLGAEDSAAARQPSPLDIEKVVQPLEGVRYFVRGEFIADNARNDVY